MTSKSFPLLSDAILGGRAANVAHAEAYAMQVLPHVKELQANGCTTLRQIAEGLAGKGIGTRRGKAWSSSAIKKLVDRL